MGYVGGNDEWDYSAPRPPHNRANRSSFYVNADPAYDVGGGGLHRSRSHGSRPQPVINVYNDQTLRNEGLSPGLYPTAPYSPPPAGIPYALDREYDRGRRLNDELADEIRVLRLDRSRNRSRSSHSPHDDYYRHELDRLEREKQLRYDRERIIADVEKKKRDEERREKDAEARMRDKIEHEKRKEKEEEEEMYRKFLLKQKEEEEKKKQKEKEHKEELEMEMRKRLSERGYSGREIENIVNDKKKETTSTTLTITKSSTPVYSKIHKSYLSIDTLKYYNIPYTWDEHDGDYIIILQEMDKHETNILFEHTKQLRSGRLMLEGAKKEKDYAFFRKRERSKSRRRGSGEWKKFGIIEYKK